MVATGVYSKRALNRVTNYVLEMLQKTFGESDKHPHVEEIQDLVELALMKYRFFKTAKAYVLYRKERERIREEKKKILEKEVLDEVDKRFSLNALRVLASRYLLKDEHGRIVESPKALFQRVAMLIVIPDILYDEKIFDKKGKQKIHEKEKFNIVEWDGKIGFIDENGKHRVLWNKWHLERMKYLYDELNGKGHMKKKWSEFLKMLQEGDFNKYYKNYLEYYRIMTEKKFLPNSPTLFNAGTRLGQLSACFVLNMEDSIESIMECAKEAALIFRSGGGIGINYSKLRPEGDIVKSTGGIASGPVSFMRIIDVVTDVVKQGGKRRGANMGILEIQHPDIEKFITAKSIEGEFENFNISVMIMEDFWQYYENGKRYPLINPRNGKTVNLVDARDLLDLIAQMAWKTGDPGVLFHDNINRHNVLKDELGPIMATNPCGEEPLYPYESCNLGSINVYAFVEEDEDGNKKFNWEKYIETIKIAYRFLDNVIDINKFPLKKIEETTKKTRRIGLGLMGVAELLFALGIPYNSEKGFKFMSKLAETLTYYSMEESVERSRSRGEFPLFIKSAYLKGEMPIDGYYLEDEWNYNWRKLSDKIRKYGIRNVEVTVVAPTGSISMIADTTGGIEPQFALVYQKNVTIGTFYYVDEVFKEELERRGIYSEELIKKISENGGSVQGIEEIPEDMKRIFVTAYDIPWWDHIRAQWEFQKWICSSISKTINMPPWISKEDVKKAYIFAHKLGLKGLTVYRAGSKTHQVLVTPSHVKGKYITKIENRTLEILREMGIEIEQEENLSKNDEAKLKLEILPKKHEITEISEKKIKRCPICNSRNLVFKEGCVICLDCGWSECIIG